ncbi:MAG TPA: DUF2812 domain-containing protein [Oscillospiraceae bacterium]|nr:DUF2812 domain-containing protein [Oscillospiraceae bacterium]
MKTTIHKFSLYKYTECDALEEYLEEMALKGWILRDINTYLTFEKAEPQKLIYSVEVFEKASIFDTRVEDKSKEYIDYCQEAGWQFVCSVGKFHVFVSTSDNCVPIETDETLKYHTIKKSMLKQNACQWFVLPLILLLNIGTQYFYSFEVFIASSFSVLLLLILIFYLILIGSQIISFCIWCRWARKNLASGQALPSYNQNDLKRRSRIRMIPTLLTLVLAIGMAIVSFIEADYYFAWFLLLVVVVSVLIWGVFILLQKMKLSRPANIALPIIIGISVSGVFLTLCIAFAVASSHENPKVYVEGNTLSVVGRSEIPLKLEDLGISPNKYRDTNKNIYRSIFAKYITYDDNTSNQIGVSDKSINYSIFESKYDFIINHYVNYRLNRYEVYKPSDASIWGAQKAFQTEHSYGYLVVYNHCVLEFRCDKAINSDMIKIIEKKLNLKEYVK